MGVYRLYTGSDGESHIEELSDGLTITMQITPEEG